MGVCLLEVPTVQSDEVVTVFWVQSCYFGRHFENFGKELRQWRNIDNWIGWNILELQVIIWNHSTWDTGATRERYTSIKWKEYSSSGEESRSHHNVEEDHILICIHTYMTVSQSCHAVEATFNHILKCTRIILNRIQTCPETSARKVLFIHYLLADLFNGIKDVASQILLNWLQLTPFPYEQN